MELHKEICGQTCFDKKQRNILTLVLEQSKSFDNGWHSTDKGLESLRIRHKSY